MTFIRSQKLIVLLCFCFSITFYYAQQAASKPSWEKLAEAYQAPDWYTKGKFGIWVHWGAQAKPTLGGGWYARHMYMQDVGRETWGKYAYENHLKEYGHPSEKGYKEVLNSWKAEELNTDEMLSFFKKIGARFFVALANHHDHFDNFASTYHPWNTVNVGPKRDIIGEFEKSARKHKLPFGVSSHDDRYLGWFKTAFGADTSGVKKGVRYDGYHTKADGKGLWWEGLDPADLYGLPPEKRTPEWIKKQKEIWQKRHLELVTKYKPDLLWFDGYGFPYGSYGKEVSRQFYLQHMDKEGQINAVLCGKHIPNGGAVEDVENGALPQMNDKPWQTICSMSGWFYTQGKPEVKRDALTVLQILADVVSKNGNLLLNVSITPQGTIPLLQKACLEELGTWLEVNGEAIYETKPWKIFGDGDGASVIVNATETDLAALKNAGGHHFNLRDTFTEPPYSLNEIRFTTRNNDLYVIVLNPRGFDQELEIPSLALGSDNAPDKKVTSIKLLGGGSQQVGGKMNINFEQTKEGLTISVPKGLKTHLPLVFKLEDVL